jgi:PhoPQ-activated pathogenicity-related protein
MLESNMNCKPESFIITAPGAGLMKTLLGCGSALLIAWPLSLAAPLQPAVATRDQTALDRYVASDDPSYKYSVIGLKKEADYTWYVLEMTSQTWRSASEVDRPVWTHWMTIIKPKDVATSTSLLFIGGGSNNDPAPDTPDDRLANIAVTTRSVVSEVRMVPNQPLTFAGDGKARVEDAMIAYTWDKFLRTGDDTWPARLPMTKAAVRAMDTVTSFLAGDMGGHIKADRFVVAGASKRGWTTWTTAAVDRRVVAIIPIVIDLLNIGPSMAHHFAAYGYWAPTIADYEDAGIPGWFGTPQFKALMRVEEPFEYRERLTLPKFIINAADDQFFLPDSSQFYFDALPGTKYLRYVPNADHSLRDTDAVATLIAAYNAVVTGAPLPKFNWEVAKDGAIHVHVAYTPSAVNLWQITNPGARDFRLSSIGPRWKSTPLAERAPGEYVAKVPRPARGWTAYFVELKYPSGLKDGPFIFTTGVTVVPDTLPFSKESRTFQDSKQTAPAPAVTQP